MNDSAEKPEDVSSGGTANVLPLLELKGLTVSVRDPKTGTKKTRAGKAATGAGNEGKAVGRENAAAGEGASPFGRKKIVNDANLQLWPGKATFLEGDSGSGKSTLVRAIAGIADDNLEVEGKILFKGTDLLDVPPEVWRKARRESFSVIFQDHAGAMDPVRRIKSSLLAPYPVFSRARKKVLENFGELMTRLGQKDPEKVLGRFPHELNAGLSQAVSLAMALRPGISVLLADEPEANLGAELKRAFFGELLRAKKSGLSLLLISHDGEWARALADETVFVEKGRIAPAPAAEKRRKNFEARGSAIPGGRGSVATILADSLRRARNRDESAAARPISGRSRPLVVAKDLEKTYLRGDKEVRALKGVSFTILRGETLGAAGESGSGKTTLAKILAGLEKPDKGTREWFGSFRGKDRNRPRLHLVFPPGAEAFNPGHRVGEILREPLRCLRPRPTSGEIERKSAELLEKVGLPAAFLGRSNLELSGGEKQRLSVIRALASEPELLILDEPAMSLDETNKAGILALLRDIKLSRTMSLFFVTHDLEAAAALSDRILVLEKGKSLGILDPSGPGNPGDPAFDGKPPESAPESAPKSAFAPSPDLSRNREPKSPPPFPNPNRRIRQSP
ncbi:MAG: ATP-binding cassette domain-containing protein [Deltaproteobacteria bacterium]|jgi:ABC-type glutathione transport system ATPase component|nr:ATP-binding cassette domain-containing protein [Deltaproteobacteria bacterium]